MVPAGRPATEPRFLIGRAGPRAVPTLGGDAPPLEPGDRVTVEASAAAFPLETLRDLPAGAYRAQAVLATNAMRIEPEITALQEWEGYVVEMDGDELVVRLVDLTAGSTHEEEEAVIPLAEISECDADTVRVGSIFRWVVGYERSPSGTKKRVSQIVFRDLPRMTERDFGEGREWARETMRAFGR